VNRTLSEDDFEFMLDAMNDALEMHDRFENLPIGASIQSGVLEVAFVMRQISSRRGRSHWVHSMRRPLCRSEARESDR
jgi:hypothetical protein